MCTKSSQKGDIIQGGIHHLRKYRKLFENGHIFLKKCQLFNLIIINFSIANVCDGSEETQECESGGGTCQTELDGYFVESFIAVIFGMLWLALWGWKVIQKLQNADEKDWRVVQSSIKTR